jgi:hypothetical protein
MLKGKSGALANCGGAALTNLDQAKIQCLRQLGADTKNWQTACLPRGVAGPVSCFANYSGKNEEILGCIAQEKPELRQAITAVRCLTNGKEASDVIAVCTQPFIKDPKLRQALAWASQSNGGVNGFGACVAGSFLGGEPGRLMTCATQSASCTGFALCAAGPKMNQEWMIRHASRTANRPLIAFSGPRS